MILVFSSTIACATRLIASCAVRFGRYPYDPAWKSASKIGSRMSLRAPWTTRSRMEGIERTLTFPPSFGISFFFATCDGTHGLIEFLLSRQSFFSSFTGRTPDCRQYVHNYGLGRQERQYTYRRFVHPSPL